MTGQSKIYRYTRTIICAWLNDAFSGDEDLPDSFWRKDAADLMKFMKAHGLEITQCMPDSLQVDPAQEGILSRLNLLAEQSKGTPRSSLQSLHPAITCHGLSGSETHSS